MLFQVVGLFFVSSRIERFDWKINILVWWGCEIPWLIVLAGTVCQRRLLAHRGHGGSNKLVWWKSKDFLFHWQMDLESLLGEIAGKIGLIVSGCLWLVENNLHGRSLLRWIRFLLFTLHQPFSEKSFKAFNAKLMHSLATLSSSKSLTRWIISQFFSRIAFQVLMGVRCFASSIIKSKSGGQRQSPTLFVPKKIVALEFSPHSLDFYLLFPHIVLYGYISRLLFFNWQFICIPTWHGHVNCVTF